LLPAIKKIKSDKHWRIRKAALEGIPNLAKNLSHSEFGTNFLDFYQQAFEDTVSAIRVCCGSCVQQLCKTYGEKWTTENFVPRLVSLWDHASGYQQKLTVLYAIQNLAMEFNDKGIFKDLVTKCCYGLKDPTPNVQLVAAQTLMKLIPLLDSP
jgi:hypothetical protein